MTLTNLPLEQSLLGGLLIDNRVFDDLPGSFGPDAFADHAHAVIFDAIRADIDDGKRADPLTVARRIRQEDTAPDLPSEYLADLLDSVLSVSAVPDYAAILIDLQRKRVLDQALSDARYQLGEADPDTTAEQLIEATQARLDEASGQRDAQQVNIGTAYLESIERERQGIQGVTTGIGALDELLRGMKGGELIVVAGRPAMGKSTLAVNWAMTGRIGDRPANSLVASLEMGPDKIARRMVQVISGVHSDEQAQLDDAVLASLAHDVGQVPMTLTPGDSCTLAELSAIGRKLQRQGRLDWILVDHIGLMDTPLGPRASRLEEISFLTRGLKRLAVRLDVPVVAVSQLSRQVEAREDKRPMLSDLRDSGTIEQDADVVLFPYREEYYLQAHEPRQRMNESTEAFNERMAAWLMRCEETAGRAEIIVAKRRDGRCGAVNVGSCAVRGFYDLEEY